MGTPVFYTLSTSTSFLTADTSDFGLEKHITLPQPNPGRLFYMKSISEIPPIPAYVQTSANMIDYISTLGFSSFQAVTLQANQTGYNLLNLYNGASVFSTFATPLSNAVVVNPSMNATVLFLDLRTESKLVQLPKIQSISPTQSDCLSLTIKDLYGNAGTSSLFIRAAPDDLIDNLSYPGGVTSTSITLADPYCSIDLIASPPQESWYIQNYYKGDLSTLEGVDPISSFYFSASVVNVNCSNLSKILTLPPASTVQGQGVTIRDTTGICGLISSIHISTQGLDVLDTRLSTVSLYNSYQSVRLMPTSQTNWAILQNFTTGIPPA